MLDATLPMSLPDMIEALEANHVRKARLRQILHITMKRLKQLDMEDKQLTVAVYLEQHGQHVVTDASRLSESNIANMLSEIDAITLA